MKHNSNLIKVVLRTGIVILLCLAASTIYSHSLKKTIIISKYNFKTTLTQLSESVRANQLFVVNRANAQGGATSLGMQIRGNQVWGIFAPQFAVQMLRISVESGFEAPIRVYIIEKEDQSVEVVYIKPSLLFQPYQSSELNLLAQELDDLFKKIMSPLQ